MTKILSNDFKAGSPYSCGSLVLKCWHLYLALVAFAVILSVGIEAPKYCKHTTIPASFDVNSQDGKQEKTAMEITVPGFNSSLSMNPGRDPLIAAITAKKQDKEMNICEDKAASIAAAGNHPHAQVTPTPFSLGQPFLAKLTINDFEHRKCFATIINVCSRTRAIVPIFEEEAEAAYVVFISELLNPGVISILTFQQLESNITNIPRLRKVNLENGSLADSLIRTYCEGKLGFGNLNNIKNSSSRYKYECQIWRTNQAAAFLELPDGKVFASEYNKHFIAFTPTNIFKGLGFVFKKGSQIAIDVSRDILNLYEIGTLKSLQENWFAYSFEFPVYVQYDAGIVDNGDRIGNASLALDSFWGLYLIFGAISTVSVLFFLIKLTRNYCCDQAEYEDNLHPC